MALSQEYRELSDYAKSLDNEACYKDFQSKCGDYVVSRLGKISDEQFTCLFNYAWEEGHSYGYLEVVIELDAILDVVEKFVEVS